MRNGPPLPTLVALSALFFSALAADAQPDFIEGLNQELCETLAAEPTETLSRRAPEVENSVIVGLILQGIELGCVSIGVLPVPETDGPQGTRSTRTLLEGEADERKRVAAEARYYIDVAIGIDSDAANDLLRRLLGPAPGDQPKQN